MSVSIKKIDVCVTSTSEEDAKKIAQKIEEHFTGHDTEISLREDCDIPKHHNVAIIADGVKITNLSSARLQSQFLNDPDRMVEMAKRVEEIRTPELDSYLDQDFIL